MKLLCFLLIILLALCNTPVCALTGSKVYIRRKIEASKGSMVDLTKKKFKASDFVLHEFGIETALVKEKYSSDLDVFDLPSVLVLYESEDDIKKLRNMELAVVSEAAATYKVKNEFKRHFPKSLEIIIGGSSADSVECNGIESSGSFTDVASVIQGMDKGSKEKLSDNKPDLIHIIVSESELEAKMNEVNAALAGRKYVEIVISNSVKTVAEPINIVDSRNLQETNSSLEIEQIEFIAVIWTCVVLAFALVFIFLCVDWEGARDPILYTTFKDTSTN